MDIENFEKNHRKTIDTLDNIMSFFWREVPDKSECDDKLTEEDNKCYISFNHPSMMRDVGLSKNKLDNWVNNHNDKYIKFAELFANKFIMHISFDQFKKKCIETSRKIASHISEVLSTDARVHLFIFAIVRNKMKKSNNWVMSIMYKYHLRNTILEIKESYPDRFFICDQAEKDLAEIMENNIKQHYIIFDDMSYSGSQLLQGIKSLNDDVFESYLKNQTNKINIDDPDDIDKINNADQIFLTSKKRGLHSYINNENQKDILKQKINELSKIKKSHGGRIMLSEMSITGESYFERFVKKYKSSVFVSYHCGYDSNHECLIKIREIIDEITQKQLRKKIFSMFGAEKFNKHFDIYAIDNNYNSFKPEIILAIPFISSVAMGNINKHIDTYDPFYQMKPRKFMGQYILSIKELCNRYNNIFQQICNEKNINELRDLDSHSDIEENKNRVLDYNKYYEMNINVAIISNLLYGSYIKRDKLCTEYGVKLLVPDSPGGDYCFYNQTITDDYVPSTGNRIPIYFDHKMATFNSTIPMTLALGLVWYPNSTDIPLVLGPLINCNIYSGKILEDLIISILTYFNKKNYYSFDICPKPPYKQDPIEVFYKWKELFEKKSKLLENKCRKKTKKKCKKACRWSPSQNKCHYKHYSPRLNVKHSISHKLTKYPKNISGDVEMKEEEMDDEL